jgi:hypothetical protein
MLLNYSEKNTKRRNKVNVEEVKMEAVWKGNLLYRKQ